MKIAILTSGILPVPAVQGGAVENLIDFYLEYNCQHHLHDITVYSVWNPDISQHPALLLTATTINTLTHPAYGPRLDAKSTVFAIVMNTTTTI